MYIYIIFQFEDLLGLDVHFECDCILTMQHTKYFPREHIPLYATTNTTNKKFIRLINFDKFVVMFLGTSDDENKQINM